MTTLAAPERSMKELRSDWETRLGHIVAMMREMSLHTDPQAMVKAYGQRFRALQVAIRTVAGCFFLVSPVLEISVCIDTPCSLLVN